MTIIHEQVSEYFYKLKTMLNDIKEIKSIKDQIEKFQKDLSPIKKDLEGLEIKLSDLERKSEEIERNTFGFFGAGLTLKSLSERIEDLEKEIKEVKDSF